MHRTARLVIAFLLALVVPWHAVAATTMCDVPVPAGHEHAMSMHAGHDGDAASRHAHGAATAKAKCGVGASCCAAAALPSLVVAFDAAPLSHRFAAFVPAGAAHFLTAGLDRPPRTVLA